MRNGLPLVLAGGIALGADPAPPSVPVGEVLRVQASSVLHAEPPARAAADTLYELGERHGQTDGLDAGVRGAALRGFAWSVVAGPLGGIVAVRRSRSASLPVPSHRQGPLQQLGGGYRDGYLDAFGTAFQPRRREATIVGSMVGSLVWTYALIRLVNLPSRAEFEGQTPDGPPPMSRIRISVPIGPR